MSKETVARQVYSDLELESAGIYGFNGNYQPIIDYLGIVLVQVSDDDYQGDTRVLYRRDDGALGWLRFGWGSCSGCDALQACNSEDDISALIVELRDSIKWFDSPEDALSFFVNHDWEGDYDNTTENQRFVKECIDQLTVRLEEIK